MSGKGKGKRSKNNGANSLYKNGEKKARLENGDDVDANGCSASPSHLTLDALLQNEESIGKLGQVWQSEQGSVSIGDLDLQSHPYTCCSIQNFARRNCNQESGAGPEDNMEDFLESLTQELGELEFLEKNNDLYKFRQSHDLAKMSSSASPCIGQFRQFMQTEVKQWLHKFTGIDFYDETTMFCARYDYTDYLGCHDDQLEGRRIAFIWYLVPATWKEEDGGALDLFEAEADGQQMLQPGRVSRSIVPARNSFVFFHVSPKSFHQVAEVLTRDKTRLSIGGWFHGKTEPLAIPRALKYLPEEKDKLDEPVDIDEDAFYEWINPLYLDPGNQAEIVENFESNSEISLQDFLADDKYSALSAALAQSGLDWEALGPANRRCYDMLPDQQLPDIVKECISFLKSDAMFLLLSNLTGLHLHPLAPEDSSSDNDDDDEEGKDNSPKASSSKEEDDETKQARKTRQSGEGESESASASATCRSEVRRWRQGSYTLIRDDDPDQKTYALESRLFFNCREWSIECGGYSSYVARDEDEELLTVQPEVNTMSLVYKDKETLNFVKRITDEVNKLPSKEFHDISLTYFE